MPVLLAPDRWPCWLGEKAATGAELKAMLTPSPGTGMAFRPVDWRVGDVHNDDPDLFRPVANPRSEPRG